MLNKIQEMAGAVGRKYEDLSGYKVNGKELKVVFVDGDVIKIQGPISGKELALELRFPSVPAYEKFLTTSRSRGDAEKLGASLRRLKPPHQESEEDKVGNEMKPDRAHSLSSASEKLEMPVEELYQATRLAWRTFIDRYQGKSK